MATYMRHCRLIDAITGQNFDLYYQICHLDVPRDIIRLIGRELIELFDHRNFNEIIMQDIWSILKWGVWIRLKGNLSRIAEFQRILSGNKKSIHIFHNGDTSQIFASNSRCKIIKLELNVITKIAEIYVSVKLHKASTFSKRFTITL